MHHYNSYLSVMRRFSFLVFHTKLMQRLGFPYQISIQCLYLLLASIYFGRPDGFVCLGLLPVTNCAVFRPAIRSILSALSKVLLRFRNSLRPLKPYFRSSVSRFSMFTASSYFAALSSESFCCNRLSSAVFAYS